jgi:hypothetical protein
MTSDEVCKPSAFNIFAAEMHTPSLINSRFALEALPSGMLQEDFTYFWLFQERCVNGWLSFLDI